MKLLSNTALIAKLLKNKTFRDAYVNEHIRNGVSFQIRAMREERGWTQGKVGEISGKPRNVITRLEDPNYGKLTITTLLEIASAFDVALLVKFIPYSRLLHEYEDTSSSALSARNILREGQQLKRWAQNRDRLDNNIPEPESHQLLLPLDKSTIPSVDMATDRKFSPRANVIPIRSYQKGNAKPISSGGGRLVYDNFRSIDGATGR